MSAAGRVTTAPCLACGHPVSELWLGRCRDLYLGTPYVVDYAVCGDCGLVQQVPVPEDTCPSYPASYPMHHSRGRLFFLARRLMIRRVYFQPGAGAGQMSLLDFGCGDGSYLQAMRDKVGRRFGFEPSSTQARQVSALQGCEVFSDLAEAGERLAATLDVVTAHFVLEHLTDLHAAFRCWQRILKPGGILHLALPNIRSWEARLFGHHWHGLDAPRHISFPDATSLSRLAATHGFVVTQSRYGVFPNTLAASLATRLVGRYQHALFLACIPMSVVLAGLMPQATTVFQLQKKGDG